MASTASRRAPMQVRGGAGGRGGGGGGGGGGAPGHDRGGGRRGGFRPTGGLVVMEAPHRRGARVLPGRPRGSAHPGGGIPAPRQHVRNRHRIERAALEGQ